MKSALGLLGSLVLVSAFGTWACSSGDSNEGGGAGPSTGGTIATGGTGGDSTTGGTGGATGGQDAGTGGMTQGNVRPPHTDLFDCSPPSGTLPALNLEEFVTGFERPVAIAPIPGTTNRYVVLELAGHIKLVENATVADTDFLDLTSRTSRDNNDWDERGLLGIAFHPNFEDNGLFYVHHTASSSLAAEIGGGADVGDTVVVEYKIDSQDERRADPQSARIVFTTSQPADNHNGGALAFGGDGMLYIALGDGGGADDQYGNGQNLSTPLGAILRIDVDGRAEGQYSYPSGNLRDTVATAHPGIWDYGLRNPWRISFDGCTGNLYIADVGQDTWEEINVEPPGGGGRNYGWPFLEGDRCRGKSEDAVSSPDECVPMGTTPAVPITLPVATYNRGGGGAVVGGYVYRGSALPALRGAYLFADYSQRRFWMLRWNGTTEEFAEIKILPSMDQAINAFGQDANGELFVVSMDGVIYRLVPAGL